jgi:ribosomal protein L11 methyltransferase
VRIVIDPGMAFGTGSHPTTALCLERIDELLAARPGADVLDVGTGSGVIAFAAVKLGAGRVCGTESDPIALDAAHRGAQLNGIPGGRIEWALANPDELAGDSYDIVVANILLNTLVDLAPQIARKVARRGTVVLSGLLAVQADAAESAYAAFGLTPGSRKEREGWVRIELTRS